MVWKKLSGSVEADILNIESELDLDEGKALLIPTGYLTTASIKLNFKILN